MTKPLEVRALGARIREEREYRGFSQEEVADHLGIARSAISLIETGSRGVEALELKKLAQLFECTVGYLLADDNEMDVKDETVTAVARAAKELSKQDREEIMRFAQFLQAKKRRRQDGKS